MVGFPTEIRSHIMCLCVSLASPTLYVPPEKFQEGAVGYRIVQNLVGIIFGGSFLVTCLAGKILADPA